MRIYFPLLICLLLNLIFSCNTEEKVIVNNQESQNRTKINPFILPKTPETMLFCGDTIYLSDLDLKERLEREILVNVYYQSATTLYLKRQKRYFPEIERILKEKNIPNDLKYIAVIESGLSQAVSPAGAKGMWQFMEKTAKEYGLEISEEVDERYDFIKSTYAACSYLQKSHDTLNNWIAAVASYNRGLSGVNRDMERQQVNHYFDTDMNSETGRYFFRLLAMKLIFENPELYGYYLSDDDYYPPYQTRTEKIDHSIKNLSEWAVSKGFNYKILSLLNPWILSNSLTVKTKSYTILLPTETEKLKPYGGYQ